MCHYYGDSLNSFRREGVLFGQRATEKAARDRRSGSPRVSGGTPTPSVFGYLQHENLTSILQDDAPWYVASKEGGKVVTKHIDEIVAHRVPEA